MGQRIAQVLALRDQIAAGLELCDQARCRHRFRNRNNPFWSDAVADTVARGRICSQLGAYADEIANDVAALTSAWAVNAHSVATLGDLGGDAHHGRYPVQICFSGDTTFIYKPRPAIYEDLIFDVLDLIAPDTGIVWPRFPTVAAKHGSWWLPIGTSAELDPIAAQRFFFAAGVLLAGAYVTGLSDLNHENIVIQGGLPCVIDAEFLCQPSMVTFHADGLAAERRSFEDTVLSTLMLPLPGLRPDPSALGSATGSTAANGKWRPSQHCPHDRQGRRYVPADYTLEICDGFLSGLSGLSHRTETIAKLLEARLSMVRVALRPTAFYAGLEAALWSDAHASASTDKRHAFLLQHLPEAGWDIGAATAARIRSNEATVLLDGNIPQFFASLCDTELYSNESGALGPVFSEPALIRRRRHLERIARGNGADQVAFIQGAMRAMLVAESRSALASGIPS